MRDRDVLNAAYAVLHALRREGPNPAHHRAVMERHRREWPTLWKGLDYLDAAAGDGDMFPVDIPANPTPGGHVTDYVSPPSAAREDG